MAASENSFEPFGFSLVLSGLGLDFLQILDTMAETVPVIPYTPEMDFKCQRYPGDIQTPHTSPLDIDYLLLQIFRSNGVLFSWKFTYPELLSFRSIGV